MTYQITATTKNGDKEFPAPSWSAALGSFEHLMRNLRIEGITALVLTDADDNVLRQWPEVTA